MCLCVSSDRSVYLLYDALFALMNASKKSMQVLKINFGADKSCLIPRVPFSFTAHGHLYGTSVWHCDALRDDKNVLSNVLHVV